MNIFIDDQRWPTTVDWVDFDYNSTNWLIARTFEQFVDLVESQSFDIISFDHDLDRSSTFECIRCGSKEEPFNYDNVKEKTGYHCAQYLKKWCAKNGKSIPKYLVHSLNPKGRENIINLLGEESLIGTHNVDLIFEKADEILKRGKSWRDKK
jgi:hypothetical protein